MKKVQGKKIRGLDSLRGVAILQIMLFHLNGNLFKGGYIGVCMFLALGGYLLMAKGIRQWEQGTFRVGGYFLKRLRRVYPGMLIVLSVTAVCFAVFIPGDVLKIGKELTSALFSVNNWWRISESQSYFSSAAEKDPFFHLWYLSVQVQLYLIFPLVLAGYMWVKKFSSRTAEIGLIVITFLGMLPMPVIYLFGGQDALSSVYYATDSRAFSFLAGCMLAVWMQKSREDRPAYSRAVFWGVLLLQIILTFVLSGSYGFTYLGGMQLITLTDLLLIVLVQSRGGIIGKVLDRTPLRRIGECSYELYLVHYPLLVLMKSLTKGRIAGSGLLFVLLYFLLAALFTILLKKTIMLTERRSFMKNFRKKAVAAALIASSMLLSSCMVMNSQAYKDHHAMAAGLEANSRYLASRENSSDAGQSAGQEENNSGQETDSSYSSGQGEEQTANASGEEGHILAVGDSVMLGAAQALQNTFPDITVDAEEGRQEYNAISEVETHLDENPETDTVIRALGTNGYFYQSDGQKMIDEIGQDRTIYWVTTYNRDQQENQNETNAVITALAEANSNVHVIAWDEEAPQHPEWFWDDGIHLNPKGQEGYAEYVKESINERLFL